MESSVSSLNCVPGSANLQDGAQIPVHEQLRLFNFVYRGKKKVEHAPCPLFHPHLEADDRNKQNMIRDIICCNFHWISLVKCETGDWVDEKDGCEGLKEEDHPRITVFYQR